MLKQRTGADLSGIQGPVPSAPKGEDGVLGNARTFDVVLRDHKDLPAAGGGETPIVAVAPAIANAIYSATGNRLRSMPLVPQGVVKS